MMFYSAVNFSLEDFLDYYLVNLGLFLYYFYVRFIDGFLEVFDDFWAFFRTFLAFLALNSITALTLMCVSFFVKLLSAQLLGLSCRNSI